MPKQTRTRPAAPPVTEGESAAAFERVKDELDALPFERLGRVTADIPTAVSLALGAIPHLESLLPRMKIVFRDPPEKQIARLRERALAALFAHVRWVPSTTAAHEQTLEEARVLREQLLLAADAHASYGHLDPNAIARIREGSGHVDRGQDLVALAALFRDARPLIGANTVVTREQLDRADVLATTVLAAVGGKTLGSGPAAGDTTWADRRLRAFRLFMIDYDEIRRTVEFMRWYEDDMDAFAPTLHPRNRARFKPVEPAPADPTTEPTDTDA